MLRLPARPTVQLLGRRAGDGLASRDHVDDRKLAQQLAQRGLAVGISSGANFLGALKAQALHGGDAPTVTILCDSNKKYLTSDLLRREPVRPEYESQHVEILGYAALARSCAFCNY